ncbi:MAG: thioredoxin domain-containing protein [Steroidobacteraceae bacterium]
MVIYKYEEWSVNERVVELTEANWDREVAQCPLPVLVDFSGAYCAPCRMLEPTVEALASDFAGQVKVGKVTCEENQELATRFGVRSVPHLVLLRGGQPVAVVQGRTRTRIADEIEGHLA